jgi:hypothetical protein
MLAQVFAALLFDSFIARAILGHNLLAEALLRPGAGPNPRFRPGADAPNASVDRTGMRAVALEATPSC